MKIEIWSDVACPFCYIGERHLDLALEGFAHRDDVEIVPRPGEPFLGAGECSQGPGGAALANAIAHAIGKRLTDLPLTRERIREAITA